MAQEVRLRGGTTAQHATFTGAAKEVTVDTTEFTLVVHDGATEGGHRLAKKGELEAALASKADATAVSTALASKADATAVSTALASKADATATSAALGKRVRVDGDNSFTAAERKKGRENIGVGSCIFAARLSANQAVGNGATKVSFDSVTTNIGGAFASSRLTAPVAGTYWFAADVTLADGVANTGSWGLSLRKNGAVVPDVFGSKTGFYDSASVAFAIDLAVGDYVEAFVSLVSLSGNPRLDGGRCSFSGFLIG